MKTLTKCTLALLSFIYFLFCPHVHAQIGLRYTGNPAIDFAHPADSGASDSPYAETGTTDTSFKPVRVVSDKFGNDWFVLGAVGAHTFQGDFSRTGDFGGTISPDFSVGIGKWFTPGLALKLECIRSKSQGYTEHLNGYYGVGPVCFNKYEVAYRKMATSWWDISGSIILNFTRMIYGFEGYNSSKNMNQLMMALGFGMVHHLGSEDYPNTDNEWSAHFELQFSRFLNKSKRLSLDLKLRNILYQNSVLFNYDTYEGISHNFDFNLGLDIGVTYHFGKNKQNDRNPTATQFYHRDFRERDVDAYRERVDTMMTRSGGGAPRTLTFYVFYPNNYSGMNDAPSSAGSNVNAIEYLLGGIFTQKKYDDPIAIANMISAETSTIHQPYSDIPTEPANNYFAINCVPRGYEMSRNAPMSLSMAPQDMYRFYSQSGYFYAPIWDGSHEWHYRIDEDAIMQQSANSDEHYENETYGLNAHSGLPILMEAMETETGDCLVSFADVYAALNGNKGFIADYTSPQTVEMIRDIFRNGIITLIEAHGVATSQDDYSGNRLRQAVLERNISLADSRVNTVMTWLKGTDTFSDTKSIVYVDNGFVRSSQKVSGPATRGLNAKLNQCVKVRIQVIY